MNRRWITITVSVLAVVVIGMYAIFNLNRNNEVLPDTARLGQSNTEQGVNIPSDLEIQRSITDNVADYGNNQTTIMEATPGQKYPSVTPNDSGIGNRATTTKSGNKQQATTPNQQTTTPNQQKTTPNQQKTTPNQQTTTPKQQATTPNQQATTPNNNTGNNNTQQTGKSNYANEVIRLVNEHRSAAGLAALSSSTSLTSAANTRAQETVQQFSHTRPNGSKFSTVLQAFNVSYNTAGENIAYGQKTPKEVVDTWMNSPGHRANIMNSNYGKIGVGVYENNGVIYWVQLFTN